MNLDNKVVGFIGGGNMAKAIVSGLLQNNLVKSTQVIISSPSELTLQYWKNLNIKAVLSNSEVINKADIIILAFKPHQLESALKNLDLEESENKLFVSILAGITSQDIYDKLIANSIKKPRVIRVMPNTPVTVCEGCSAISPHSSALKEDINVIEKIFSSVGITEVVIENYMSALTGLIGSGPAYIYTLIEALSDGAVKQGVPRQIATSFAAQTVLGSAKMVLSTKKHPGQLKDEVCSAGGTTIHGIHALEKCGVRAALMNAVEAAAQRADEIGKKSKK
ncbi:Pyrroline-5-carboxylate reductase, putative [Pediculus humanus corporis]|uniref:Pyrroline-5-carboxylate reductase n=1 Tax=Pediculus humanus subsp. corporis TaxID=121224 RepID=E0VE13_PEDHC|nr:Pyrroline-5-carboxylate reductase, putative [Pediculus humanus corporis]EEB11619.1 Pyrroline-5-carboxylate reductase, putative [Pediculus humanus corporis]